MTAITHTIRRLADENFAAAVRQGYEGEQYEQTAADCEYIIDEIVRAFGRKPTREEWTDAGFAGIGDSSCTPEMVLYWQAVRDNCSGGDDTPEQQICRALNVETAEIDEDGDVWVAEQSQPVGWWVRGDALVDLVAKIERGV